MTSKAAAATVVDGAIRFCKDCKKRIGSGTDLYCSTCKILRIKPGTPLSPLETQVVELISKGLQDREIAQQLHMKSHVHVAQKARIARAKLGINISNGGSARVLLTLAWQERQRRNSEQETLERGAGNAE